MSREIDKQVAEALGWRCVSSKPAEGGFYNGVVFTEWYPPGSDEEYTSICGGPPPFSTDIAAAIGALKEFCAKYGYEWMVKAGYCEIDKIEQTDYGKEYDPIGIGEDDEDPAAICSAILAAHTSAGEGE